MHNCAAHARREVVRADEDATFSCHHWEALRIHCLSLDGVVLHNLVSPFTELDGALVIDLEAYGDNSLQAIVLRLIVFAIGGSY